jgi:hypothetical protein
VSGDCGHGWLYHHGGPSGPCYACDSAKVQTCANCGKRRRNLIWHAGKWWCPGACDVTRKPKTPPAPGESKESE